MHPPFTSFFIVPVHVCSGNSCAYRVDMDRMQHGMALILGCTGRFWAVCTAPILTIHGVDECTISFGSKDWSAIPGLIEMVATVLI